MTEQLYLDIRAITDVVRPAIHNYYQVVRKAQVKPCLEELVGKVKEAVRTLVLTKLSDPDLISVTAEESIHFVELKVKCLFGDGPFKNLYQRHVEVTITEPKYGGISPEYLSHIYPSESSAFLHDAILFAKGLYGQWDDLRGMVALYQHHYAATDRIYVYEGNFFNIIRVLMPAMEAAGIVVTHDEYAKMLKLVFQRDLDSALGILVSKLTLIPIARVNNVPLMWGTNQIVASVLLPYVKAKEA